MNMSTVEMKRYFSKWFNIISFAAARRLLQRSEVAILLLLSDGTDRYLDDYDIDELQKLHENGALFGIEK